jgi:hypothetical protein
LLMITCSNRRVHRSQKAARAPPLALLPASLPDAAGAAGAVRRRGLGGCAEAELA